MIDTIVLTLSRNMFTISNPDKFEPSARLILGNNTSMGSRGYIQCKQNPTKEELRSGFYKPRLTLTNRFNHTGNREPTLKIELSLPKLLLKNNFNELTDHDFERVIELLEANLKYMGVQVSTLALKQASVSSIHYSKNISLSNGITSRYLIRKIKEANVKMALDINQTDYKNEGYSYKWHSNTYEIAFYDKIKDLETAKFSEKRAIEKDNELQSNLFPELIKRPEVLRIEVRLNNRQKMIQLFNTLGISSDLIFQNLFSLQISQKVLLHYLNEIGRNRPLIYDYNSLNAKKLLSDLIINHPKLGIIKTIQLFGLKIALDKITPRELRAMFGNYHQRSWYRLIAQARNTNLPASPSPFSIIRENITNYQPLNLVVFMKEMLNNDKYHTV